MAIPLGDESLGGVVGVDLAHQSLERRREDAVTLFELRGLAIARAEAHRGPQARIVPEECAQPDHVVIAPEQVHLGLTHECVDDAVDARAAITQITDHEQFIARKVADEASAGADCAEVAIVTGEAGDEFADVVGTLRAAELDEELAIVRLEELFEVIAAEGGAEDADDFKLQFEGAMGPGDAAAAIDDLARELVDGFARVVEHREEALLFFRAEAVAQHAIDETAKRAAGVVDDVTELGVFAVHIGDDVNDAAREGELGAKRGSFTDRSVGGGKLRAEGTQVSDSIGRQRHGGSRKQNQIHNPLDNPSRAPPCRRFRGSGV